MKANKIFSQGNPFNEFMTKVFNVMEVNLLWTVCSLGIITIGASTTAMYYVLLKMTKDEDTGISKMFFHSFKENFKQSIPLTLIMLGLGTIVVLDFHILGTSDTNGGSMLYGFSLVLMMVLIAVYGYVWPLLARFVNTVGGTLNNAWRLAVTHLPKTLLMTAGTCIPFLWFLLWPGSFIQVFWIWLVIGTAAVAFGCSFLLEGILEEIAPEDEKEEDHD
ncbi:MAG: YesL family protein [Solobacterium sp.]|jgi:uncharacterized membrane protein YesL|nr:YesL family protein [Solobacterium sp.]MCH4221836.1 YesL family protein [Solobacterium sp.]MCH4265159.1 YesL family protein [Solobacterium sp.]